MKKILATALVVFLVAAFLLASYVSGITEMRAASAPPVRADAIVVLTGGKGRTGEGLRLLREGAAGLMILSGVHPEATLEAIFLAEGVSPEEGSKIILEKRSGSTYQNAVEVAGLVRGAGIGSVVLITSGYHMKRALAAFRHTMPEGVEVIPYTIESPNLDSRRWWNGTSLGIVMAEAFNYWVYEARFVLGV